MRIVAQAANSASLLIDNVAERVVMPTTGVLLYLSFLGETTAEHVATAVSAVASVKVFNHLDGIPVVEGQRSKPQSIAEVPACNVLIIPQATLAGKPKGKQVQYHAQCDKVKGEELYYLFCKQLRDALIPDAAQYSFDRNGRLVGDKMAHSEAPRGDDGKGAADKATVEYSKALDGTVQSEANGRTDVQNPDERRESGSSAPQPLLRLVLNGTYGNRQALSLDSHGPMTHMFEF